MNVDELTIGEVKELSALLADHFLAIDHIGSTSVPDLPAKDVIDIQITVADMKDSKVKELTENFPKYKQDLVAKRII